MNHNKNPRESQNILADIKAIAKNLNRPSWVVVDSYGVVRQVEGDGFALRAGRKLEVHYRRGTVAPRVGDRLDTWLDGATLYAMAPRA